MIVKLLNRDQINSSKEYSHLEEGSFIISLWGNEKDVHHIADATGVAWYARPSFKHGQDAVEAIFTLYDESSARALMSKISELHKGLSTARQSLATAIKNCEV